MVIRYSAPRQTHEARLERAVTAISYNEETVVDYTIIPVDWHILGHLSTGQLTKSTILCGQCGRVGVLATSDSQHLIVHRGRVDGDVLHAIDYCEWSITVH